MHTLKMIECPRDAMQGIKKFIPTELKIEYLNILLKAGFDTLDFGSFVSHKAIPQMKDTILVLKKLNLTYSDTKLLAIIANIRGADTALEFDEISYLGYPFSVSETFQQRNTGRSIDTAVNDLDKIINKAISKNKEVVTYLSMGFGNPYKDKWNVEIVESWTDRIISMGCKIISLADTVGSAKPNDIAYLFKNLIKRYPETEFGAHLHATPDNWRAKIEAALENGCKRFDSAIKGYGGCPMAEDKLTGNIATERLAEFFKEKKISLNLNFSYLNKAIAKSINVFN